MADLLSQVSLGTVVRLVCEVYKVRSVTSVLMVRHAQTGFEFLNGEIRQKSNPIAYLYEEFNSKGETCVISKQFLVSYPQNLLNRSAIAKV